MATPYNAPYKKAQRAARARRGLLTPPPSEPLLAVKIGNQHYVSARNQYGRAAGWVRVGGRIHERPVSRVSV